VGLSTCDLSSFSQVKRSGKRARHKALTNGAISTYVFCSIAVKIKADLTVKRKLKRPFEFSKVLVGSRALQLRREARMVSLAMGAAMMSTMYFVWGRCAQHGGEACGGDLVCVSLRSYRALVRS